MFKQGENIENQLRLGGSVCLFPEGTAAWLDQNV
jgi:hypothetical protein